MNYAIEELLGFGDVLGRTLRLAGIHGTRDLLAHCASRDGRMRVAERTGIPENRLLVWVNKADLMRIPGIGTQFADLLEEAGVDTVEELSVRKAPHLAWKMSKLSERSERSLAAPSEAVVSAWIRESRRIVPTPTR